MFLRIEDLVRGKVDMLLRKLKKDDAPLMLEWMHDESVVNDLQNDFASLTLKDAEAFIEGSINSEIDLHLAIASDNDEYMGTVSLKHIDRTGGSAEFAITIRKSAMGKGFAWFAMSEIIRIAFEEKDLDYVYWCVSEKNLRAVNFYRKNNFKETTQLASDILERYRDIQGLLWFAVYRRDDNDS